MNPDVTNTPASSPSTSTSAPSAFGCDGIALPGSSVEIIARYIAAVRPASENLMSAIEKVAALPDKFNIAMVNNALGRSLPHAIDMTRRLTELGFVVRTRAAAHPLPAEYGLTDFGRAVGKSLSETPKLTTAELPAEQLNNVGYFAAHIFPRPIVRAFAQYARELERVTPNELASPHVILDDGQGKIALFTRTLLIAPGEKAGTYALTELGKIVMDIVPLLPMDSPKPGRPAPKTRPAQKKPNTNPKPRPGAIGKAPANGPALRKEEKKRAPENRNVLNYYGETVELAAGDAAAALAAWKIFAPHIPKISERMTEPDAEKIYGKLQAPERAIIDQTVALLRDLAVRVLPTSEFSDYSIRKRLLRAAIDENDTFTSVFQSGRANPVEILKTVVTSLISG